MSCTRNILTVAVLGLTAALLPRLAVAVPFTSGAITSTASLQVSPFVIASDLGAAPPTTTISGVGTFTDDAGGYFSGSDYGGGFLPSLGNSDLESLLQTSRYNPTISTGTVGSGIPVTIGHQYVLEMLFFEPGGLTGNRMLQITAESDSTNFSTISTGSVASFLDYAFTALDSSLDVTIQITGAGIVTDNAIISGFSLKDVTPAPEPSSLALIGMAMMGLIRGRRCRR